MTDRRIGADLEEREAARIEATRERHAKLRERLLNPNVRLAGRDEQALAQQVADKHAALENERDDERRYAEWMRATQHRMRELEIESQEKARAQKQAIRDEWQAEAARKAEEKQRELAEYHRLETHIGVSSAQQLDGEDETSAARRAMQQKQMRKWVAQQEAERRLREEEAAREAREYAEFEREQLRRAQEAEDDMNAQRRNKLREQREFNEFMAKKRKDETAFERKLRMELEAQNIDSPFVRADAPQTSAQSPHRLRPDHYRGLDARGLESIRDEQRRQMIENEERKRREREEEEAWALQQERMAQMANMASYEEQEARRKAEQNVLDVQRMQLEQRRLKEQEERRRMHEPVIGEGFFSGFGRSHR